MQALGTWQCILSCSCGGLSPSIHRVRGGLKDLEQQIGSNRIPLKCSYMAGEPDKLATNNESPYLLRPEIDTGQLYRLII